MTAGARTAASATARSSTAQAKPKGPAGDGAAARLADAALVKGDADGYEVSTRKPNEREAAWAGAPASPSACAPLADLLTPATPPKAKARFGREVTSKGGSTTYVELYAYADSDAAARALKDLRAAAKSKRCATFRTGDPRYSGVKALTAPDKGDEAVAYRLGRRVDTFVERRAVTVVRDGSTLVSFAATNLYDPEGVATDVRDREESGAALGDATADTADMEPKVPAAVVDAQLAKLAKSGKPGKPRARG
ncbi:hypothetical protein RB200_30885 [Streptomyces sp. PmtG]